ncbi:class I SAM-dependent methyltransferase [Labrys okinawensis]|uniref:class I SAM-dependent methyltransferase n=1 Tax=Labrys okinawensis TaxID=346911 RepID=UPI0039BCF58B
MSSPDGVHLLSSSVREQAAALFQTQWQTYRKVVDNNYLFHNDAYAALHQFLIDEQPLPFSFLDIACGDASSTFGALAGTAVARYVGVDLSEYALELAARGALLSCPCAFRLGDLADALTSWSEPMDVIWIGLSLHHFRAPQKLDLMRECCRIVGGSGKLVIYENAGPDGETRDDWLARWDCQRPNWHAFTPAEWAALRTHVHEYDFPETVSSWHELGRAAGFVAIRQLFASPTDLFRLFVFQA